MKKETKRKNISQEAIVGLTARAYRLVSQTKIAYGDFLKNPKKKRYCNIIPILSEKTRIRSKLFDSFYQTIIFQTIKKKLLNNGQNAIANNIFLDCIKVFLRH